MSKLIANQFRAAVEAAARAADLEIVSGHVKETLSLVNLAQGSATMCFRVRLPRVDTLAPAAETLRNFRRTFTATHKSGKSLDVECVLSGIIRGGKMIDWEGKPVESVG